jgi:hypothetical protein
MTIKAKTGVKGTRYAVYVPNYVGTFKTMEEAIMVEKENVSANIFKKEMQEAYKKKKDDLRDMLDMGKRDLGYLLNTRQKEPNAFTVFIPLGTLIDQYDMTDERVMELEEKSIIGRELICYFPDCDTFVNVTVTGKFNGAYGITDATKLAYGLVGRTGLFLGVGEFTLGNKHIDESYLLREYEEDKRRANKEKEGVNNDTI